MIRVLPEDVRCRLRSGIAITSVSQCIEELLLNSADAQATCVAIRVDLEIFRVQVVDNGCGLGPEDMERVGMRYFTSKCHSLKDLEDLRCYGFRGEAIASMADVCSVVEISSKHKPTGKTFTKLFQNRKPLPVQQAEVTRPSVGTTVTLYNLFYNLPVRRGCIDPVVEMERIRQKVEAASLMKPDISFSLKNDSQHSMVLQLPKTRDVCSRFCQIYGRVKSQHLREIRHTQDRLGIVGYISCEGHYNKTMQFLYVNSRLVLKTRLHKLLDSLLKKESVICRPKASQGGHTSGSPGFHRSSSDLHGIYVLNIQCSYEEYDICFEPDKTLIEFQDWSAVLVFVEQAIKTFLKKENLYSEPSREEVTEFNQKNQLSLSCNELSPEGRSPTSIGNIDPASLRSKSVCRRQVMSLHAADNEKTASKGNIPLALPVTTEGFDEGPNLVTEREDDTQHRNEHGDVIDGGSRLQLVASDSSLAQQPEQPTLTIKSPIAEHNSSKPSAWCIDSTGGDPGPSSTNRPLDSEHIAVMEKKPHRSLPYCADRLSVFSGRTRTLGTHRITGMSVYKMATAGPEWANTTKPLKLRLPLALDSLDRFKRSYSKNVPDARGLQLSHGAEPAGTETSCTSVGQIQPAPPETILHMEGVKMVAKSPFEPAETETCTLVDQIQPAPPETMLHTEWAKMVAESLFSPAGTETSCTLVDQIQPAPPETTLHTEGAKMVAERPFEGKKNMAPESPLDRKNMAPESPLDRKNMAPESPLDRKNMAPESPLDKKNMAPESPLDKKNMAPESPLDGMKVVLESTFEENIVLESPLDGKNVVLESPFEGKNNNMVPESPSEGKNVVLESPLTPCLKKKEPETGKPQSSLSTKLCRLKQSMELALFPLEIRSGELQLRKDSKSSMAEHGSTVSCSDTQTHENVTIDDAGSVDCQPQSDDSEPPHTPPSVPPQETEWLQHYEQTLGRNVFINTSTGLSTYSAPQADQSTACTKDLSTMPVNVVCSNGFQYQCYPFRSDLLMPFLPRPSAERGLLSYKGDGSLQTMYSKWQNPVFPRHPEVAVDTSKDHSDPLAVKIHNILYPYRFTKDMILTMEVLQQVDNKFIACLVDTKDEKKKEPGGNLLVLVDQHAAHERVRLEQLIADSYEPSSEEGGRRLKVSTVRPPLELDVTEEQSRLLRIRAGVLQRAGLSLSFPDNCPSQVLVSEIPQCFLEKNSETPKKRVAAARKMVEEFLQEEVQRSPGAPIVTLPGTVLKVLASQACHGAVKFNDPLTVDECRHLVRCLAQCSLPFQCAHGRPAIMPLADLLHLQPEDEVPPKPNISRLRRHYKAWRLFGTEQPIRGETCSYTNQSQADGEPQ